MKNKKLLFILIPIILIVLILIAGVVFLKLNSTPEKIFKNSISAAFKIFESSEEQYTTMKGTMNLTANVESDNEEMEAINTMLEGANIGLNMEVDTNNMIVNENVNVTYNNESLLNAIVLLQDEKGYVCLPDWLDKYLELSEDELEYSELVEYSEKMATLDQNKLMEAIKEELIALVPKQKFIQEKNEDMKISSLDLSQEEFFVLGKELLENLKQNEMFNSSLGEYKEEVIAGIDEMIMGLSDMEYDENSRAVISIYTKGILNKFTGVSIELKDGEDTAVGMLLAIGKVKSEFIVYEQYNGEREEFIKVRVEDRKESKDKGTATITITAGEEQMVVVYDYETQGNHTTFEASTEIEGVKVIVSGNVVESRKNYKGNLTLAVEQEEIGRINLNCTYDFTYGVEVQKVDTQNAVLIDELSEEDQEELMANLQNSPLYKLIEQSGLLENKIGTVSDKPEVTYDGYTVKYTVPNGFEASSYNLEDMKMYMDESYNSVNVYINNDTVDEYMKSIEEEYAFTSSLYKNQQISETKKYTLNGKEYKFRTLTYDDEFDSYVNLYFAYELDNEYCYVVEVETEGGNMSMETVKYFLDVIVE